MAPKYPDIEVTWQEGNTFSLVGTILKAIREHGAGLKEQKAFMGDMLKPLSEKEMLEKIGQWVSLTVIPEEDIICPDPYLPPEDESGEDEDWGDTEEEEWDD